MHVPTGILSLTGLLGDQRGDEDCGYEKFPTRSGKGRSKYLYLIPCPANAEYSLTLRGE